MERKTLGKWCLIEIPDDLGVAHVGGRIGASQGPQAFRRIFERLSGDEGLRASLAQDFRLQRVTQNIDENHRAAIEFTSAALRLVKGPSVLVGGGHDHGYTHLKGVADAWGFKKLGCINIDAHLDLRPSYPKITSGSPFYLAIEDGVLNPARFVEFGIQKHCNKKELFDYAAQKKIKIHFWEDLRSRDPVKIFQKELSRLSKICDGIVLSLDLDALSEAHCPGVSAPQADGFSSREIFDILAMAGQNKKVISLGIFELNPVHDRGDQTARVAVGAALQYVRCALRAL